MYALVLPLVVVSGLVFAKSKTKDEPSAKTPPTQMTRAEWEATPEGIKYKEWEASPEGKKVYAAEAKIMNSIKDSTSMEAVITSLTLPPGSRLGFGMMVTINGEDYILGYGPVKSTEFQQLQSLKVDDKIIIRSRNLMHAPKYAYPIIGLNYVELNGKIIYKRVPPKGGC